MATAAMRHAITTSEPANPLLRRDHRMSDPLIRRARLATVLKILHQFALPAAILLTAAPQNTTRRAAGLGPAVPKLPGRRAAGLGPAVHTAGPKLPARRAAGLG